MIVILSNRVPEERVSEIVSYIEKHELTTHLSS